MYDDPNADEALGIVPTDGLTAVAAAEERSRSSPLRSPLLGLRDDGVMMYC